MENNLYVSPSPHIHGGDSISKNMYGVLIALIPAFLVSLYFFGLGALIVTVVSVLACMIFEYLIQRFLMKKEPTLCDGSAILTGVLLAFNLPSNLPVWIMPLKVQYPQGGEKQLIDAVIRRQVKSGALPISAGAVVQNVGTAYAVYEAVQKNKPLFERVVTITGKAVANPSNFLVRMGTPISCLIEAAGGLPENTGKIIGGGPMMGKALISAEVPVCKGSSGVLLLTTEESVRKPIRDCIRCAKCVGVCPMGLNPTLLMNATEFQNWELAEKNYITDCIECGSCSYTCPANRPLLDQIRLGKGKVMGIIRSRKS